VDPPTISRSGHPIAYALPSDNPNIGFGASSLEDITAGKKRKATSTKALAHKLTL